MISLISLILGNFSLSMFVLAFLISFVNAMINRTTPTAEILFRWLVVLPLGVTALYAFTMHAFLREFTATTIGWHHSPFQFEVALANLGFGVIALLSFKASFGFRLATVIGNTCWLWGDSFGFLYQMIHHYHRFNFTVTGPWFYVDVLLPLLLIGCLMKLKLEGTKD